MLHGGKWTRWGRGSCEGYTLALGSVRDLCGQVCRSKEDTWRASIGAIEDKHFADREGAVAYVETEIQRKMRDVLVDWHKFCAARGLP